MNRRPDLVTIAAILTILSGCHSVLGHIWELGMTDRLGIVEGAQRQQLLTTGLWVELVDGIVLLVCGFNILLSANWARWLFLVEAVLICGYEAYAFPDQMQRLGLTIIIRVIYLVFLFLPNANAYFSGDGDGRRRRRR